jgi:hypothetical protein
MGFAGYVAVYVQHETNKKEKASRQAQARNSKINEENTNGNVQSVTTCK